MQGQQSLVGCHLWGLTELDKTDVTQQQQQQQQNMQYYQKDLPNPVSRTSYICQLLYQPRQHIKKQRHYFANKGQSIQAYGFSSGHVWV